MKRLKSAYEQVRIGSPFDPETLCGPVHTKASIDLYEKTIRAAQEQGGRILFGGEVIECNESGGNFVVPSICEFDEAAEITKSESFVPILYTMKFKVRRSFYHALILIFCAF